VSSWRSMFLTTRAAWGILALAGVGLILPPQMGDMLQGMTFRPGRGLEASIAFHVSLWLMAFLAWHWGRAVLSARFPDSAPVRGGAAAAASAGDGASADDDSVDPVALGWIPRLLFIAAAAIGIAAAIRSATYWHVAIILAWAAVSILALHYRLALLAAIFGKRPAAPQPRIGTLDVVRRAPLGPAVGWLMLFFGTLLFLAGALQSFLPGTEFLAELPILISTVFPGPSVVLVNLGLGIGPLILMTYFSDRFRFSWTIGPVTLGLRRPPIFTALFLLVLVTPRFIDLHAVRVVPATAETIDPGARQALGTLFADWARSCARDQKSVRPIVVAVSGGAARAGLWAARVLADVDRVAAANGTAVFAISSVSGGSLGVAEYLSLRAGDTPAGTCALDGGSRAAQDAALRTGTAADALGPLLAGALFGDIPRSLLGLPAYGVRLVIDDFHGRPNHAMRGGDRAEALERGFERNWRDATGQLPAQPLDAPYLSLVYGKTGLRHGMPLWIANGTDQQLGQRIVTAPFAPYPITAGSPGQPAGDLAADWPFLGATDALSLLGGDVPISTAIDNTARFPFLSPVGELESVNPAKSEGSEWDHAAQVIDGGYFENEGMLTALELADWLGREGSRHADGRAVQPVLVQITSNGDTEADDADPDVVRCNDTFVDDPATSQSSERPWQFVAPIIGLLSVREGHSREELLDARAAYCKTDHGQSFFHFFLYKLKDGESVPLNWALSDATADSVWISEMAQGLNPSEWTALGAALKAGDQARGNASGPVSTSPD
jgi:hypothetical protein